MEHLLTEVLNAHGGASAWQEVQKVAIDLTFGGPFWKARGWPEPHGRPTATLAAHEEHITLEQFPAPDRQATLETNPEQVVIRDADGETLDERAEPRGNFPLPFDAFTTEWDAVQVAYFATAACWTYFTTPFVLAAPGVRATEIEPWQEGGETWRRLAVRFPDSITTHNTDQTYYFGEDLLLRRLDYSPDVTSNPPIAHYTYDNREFDGFVFPTRRRVYLHDAEGHADTSLAVIELDLQNVEITRA